MSNRLNTERQEKLEPQRIKRAIDELRKLGIEPTNVDDTRVCFSWKGFNIQYFPYSGWHTGKSIKDGRGFNHLFDQLKPKDATNG